MSLKLSEQITADASAIAKKNADYPKSSPIKINYLRAIAFAKKNDEEMVKAYIATFLEQLPPNLQSVLNEAEKGTNVCYLETLVSKHKNGEAAFFLGIRTIYNQEDASARLNGAKYILQSGQFGFPVPTEVYGLAQFIIALIKLKSDKINDKRDGATHMLKAAEFRYVPAFKKIAKLYEDGNYIGKSYEEAAKWYSIAKVFAPETEKDLIDSDITRVQGINKEDCSRGLGEANELMETWKARAETV